jgi:Family of unknown function (DUF5906)
MSDAKHVVECISVVDYYNFYCVDEVLNLLKRCKNSREFSPTAISFIINKGDEKYDAIAYENNLFVVKRETGTGLVIGQKYSPFMVLQVVKFKGSLTKALNFVETTYLNKSIPFIRVGTKYYKQTTIEDRYGIIRSNLVLWDKPTIVQDYDYGILEHIEKFDDFTLHPCNKSYSRVINNNYNLYAKFEHTAVPEKEYDELNWYWIRTLIEHIFGEQYELGIKYLKVLYDHPEQPLPILVLISEERSTGKTTFVDFLNILFGANMVLINPEDIKGSFNEPYANKNIIAIEESRFDSIQSTEKLKNLATQKEILVNSKNVRQFSIPFYGKLIITSNDETKFSRVDTSEIRYWVRKIPTLKGKSNHNILKDMKSEIPQFLAYINSLEAVDLKQSRMVFTEEEIATKHLVTVKKESRSNLLKDIELHLEQFCMDNQGVENIYFTALNIKEKFFSNNNKYELSYINSTLKNEMKLEREKMQRFIPFETDGPNYIKKIIGTPYKYKNQYYDKQASESNASGILEENSGGESKSGIQAANY